LRMLIGAVERKEDGMPEGTDVFEIMHTLRAMRRLKPDPVPEELIRKILLAGQAAASGGNTQRWRFLVLKDPEIKKKVQVYYKKAFDEVVGPRYASSPPPPGSDAARGIPQGFHSYAILRIGYPMGRFGPVGRGPLADVVYLDGWGKPYPGI